MSTTVAGRAVFTNPNPVEKPKAEEKTVAEQDEIEEEDIPEQQDDDDDNYTDEEFADASNSRPKSKNQTAEKEAKPA